MKTRKGFVSNSSSTSFCIYGICLEESEIKKLAGEDPEADEFEGYEFLDEKLEGEKDLEFHCNDDTYWVGRSYTTIKDNETGESFKMTTALKLRSLFPNIQDKDIQTFEESWYNG